MLKALLATCATTGSLYPAVSSDDPFVRWIEKLTRHGADSRIRPVNRRSSAASRSAEQTPHPVAPGSPAWAAGNITGHPTATLAAQRRSSRAKTSLNRDPPGSEAGLRLSWQKREDMRPKKTILCVDDNEQILSVRTFLLETRGYRVVAVGSPHDALEAISHSLPGSIDLLLCDLIMPQMDGNELVRRAKQLHPMLPAMIVSGTITAYDRAGRADCFLPKGAGSPAEMLERIRVLVTRKRGPRKASLPLPADPNMNHPSAISA
ncbi:MAG TPA: response regulator [Acidobacteriaceae bacterium]|nr:response regulator [Acidobacteriaceae bacterium]